MTLLFILGISMVLLAIVLVGSALSSTTETGVTRSLAVLEAMTNAPTELTKDLDRSFADRVLEPLAAARPRPRAGACPARTPPTGSAASWTWPATRTAGPSTGSSPARSSARWPGWCSAWSSA